MLVLKALIRLAERVTLSKVGASEQSLAFYRQAKTDSVLLRLTIKLHLNIIERRPHHELEAVICHDLCFAGVVIDSNGVICHGFRIFGRDLYALYSTCRHIKLGQYITVNGQMRWQGDIRLGLPFQLQA